MLLLLVNRSGMSQINLLVPYTHKLIRKGDIWSKREREREKKTKIYDSAGVTLKPGPLNEHIHAHTHEN